MSDYNPAEVVPATGRAHPQPFAEEDAPPAPASTPASAREGLPSTYRMRAEDHYVDELLSRRSSSRGERARDAHEDLPSRDDQPDGVRRDEPRRDEPAEPPVPMDLGAERRERVLAQLSDEIATIESAAALLGEQASPVSRRVGVDLIRAQARRAAWMLRAHAIAAGTHLPAVRQRTVGSLLSQIRDGLAAECRLAGVSLQMQAADLQATVAVDDDAVAAGVEGAIIATLGLVAPHEGAALRVTAVALGGDLRTVEVRQDVAPVSPQVRRRCFDPSWTDRPGGWMAAFGAETARAVARACGGDATFLARDRRGSTLRLTLSRLA